ncbi:hypothetical protein D3C87_1562910 [compost metagenome]
MYQPTKDVSDALKIIAQHDPKEAQAIAIRLINQHDEDQFQYRVKAVACFAGACLVGTIIWFLI